MNQVWIGLKIREELAIQADKYMNVKNDFGIPLFDSRAAVVEKALMEFFERHRKLLRQDAQTLKVKA